MIYLDGENHMEVPIYGSNSWNALIQKVIKAAEEAEELEALALAIPMPAEADVDEPTDYTPHASGVVAVTSAAATDLDDTAAALDTLVGEVRDIENKLNNLLAKLRTAKILA